VSNKVGDKMVYNEIDKEKIKTKWRNVFVLNCNKCNHTGYLKQDNINIQCECLKMAIKCYKLEISNIPMQEIKVSKEDIKKYVKYDFDLYFNIILNEVFFSKDLYLYNLPFKINSSIITYIAKELINKKHKLTQFNINVRYVIYEDLIQLSLNSNYDKTNKSKLINIINKSDVLFIDNVGLETGFGSSTKHNVKLLYTILKERRNKLKSTVISSNLYISDIETAYNKDVAEILKNYDMIKGDE